MMKKLILTSILLFSLHLASDAQVYSSGKKALFLDNKPVEEEPAPEPDLTSPSLTIITPDLSQHIVHVSLYSTYKIAGKAEDEGGIASLMINSQEVSVSAQGHFLYYLPLEEGVTTVSVVAFDKSDNMTEKKFLVEFGSIPEPDQKAFYEKGKYYALLIAVNNYSDPELIDLDNPIRDAKRVNRVIIENYLFDQENVTLLENPNRIEIINELDRLSEVITPDDNLLIFYAGHGYWDQNAQIGYWLPSDATKSSKAAWFRNSTLCDYLKEIDSKHTLLIADACFAGGIFKTREAFSEAPKAISMLYELPSRKAMTSGTLTEVPDRSAFIDYLVKRLEANNSKFLSSEQLFSSFRIAVINNSDVVPQYGEIKAVGDEGGDFIFVRKSSGNLPKIF